MNFISTRGGKKVTGAQAVISGLASGGGLFVPDKIPKTDEDELYGMLEMSYAERAAKIISKFFDDYGAQSIAEACEKAYGAFDGDPAPLVRLDDEVYMLELWHGATCSCQDIPTSLMPYFVKEGFKICGVEGKVLVLAATSGDVGKAALESFKGEENAYTAVFYPSDGVSKIQKLQIVTEEGEKVFVSAVKGNFDDTLSSVKNILGDPERLEKLKEKGFTAVSANSLNICQLVPKIAYFFSAYLDLVSSEQIERGEEVDFVIPSGDFSGATAGYYAKLMGLPIRRIHCASNENCTVSDFLTTGVYNRVRQLLISTSPAMDILAPSDLERLLFEISGRNAKLTADRMNKLVSDGSCEITKEESDILNQTFDGGCADEDEAVEAMYDVFIDVGYTMDTCTGCAMKVAVDWFEKHKKEKIKTVILSVANPYKYPQDVLYAVTGNDVKDSFKGVKRLHAATAMAVPKCIKELRDKPVRFSSSVSPDKIFDEILKFIK